MEEKFSYIFFTNSPEFVFSSNKKIPSGIFSFSHQGKIILISVFTFFLQIFFFQDKQNNFQEHFFKEKTGKK